MKYTEFEAKVKEIDGSLSVKKLANVLVLKSSIGTLLLIDAERTCSVDSIYPTFEIYEHKQELFDLATELAATPLEERKEPKKYYYRLIYSYVASDDNCLNYDTEDNVLFYGNKEQEQNFKTQFTREEYAAIAKEHGIPANLHIEEEVK